MTMCQAQPFLEAIEAAERVMIMHRSPEQGKLTMQVLRFRDPGNAGTTVPISRTLINWVLTERMALVSPNLCDDLRFQAFESIRIDDDTNQHWNSIQQSFAQISRLSVEMLDYAKDPDLKLGPVDINQAILANRNYFELPGKSKKDIRYFLHVQRGRRQAWACRC